MKLSTLSMFAFVSCISSQLAAVDEQAAGAGAEAKFKNYALADISSKLPLENAYVMAPLCGFVAAAAIVASNNASHDLQGLLKIAVGLPCGVIGGGLGLVSLCLRVRSGLSGVINLFGAVVGFSEGEARRRDFKRGLTQLALGVPIMMVTRYYSEIAYDGNASSMSALNPLKAFAQ